MPIPLGEDAIIMFGLAAPPTTQVLGINSWDAPSQRPDTTRAYFMMPKQTFVGAPEDTFQLQGDYNQADPGQVAIRSAYRAGTEGYIEILPDGTNGFYQKVRVTQAPHRGPSPDDPPGVTFNFAATDDPVDVGTGL